MTSRKNKSIVFKSDLCIGCYSCVVSCMDQNDLDVARDNLSWRIVENVSGRLVGKHPGNVSVSIACMHCEDAVCIAACPAGAITRDAATGSVLVDDGLCIGCHACEEICPHGALHCDTEGYRINDEKCFRCRKCINYFSGGGSRRVSGTARPTRLPTNRSTFRWTRKRPAQPEGSCSLGPRSGAFTTGLFRCSGKWRGKSCEIST